MYKANIQVPIIFEYGQKENVLTYKDVVFPYTPFVGMEVMLGSLNFIIDKIIMDFDYDPKRIKIVSKPLHLSERRVLNLLQRGWI